MDLRDPAVREVLRHGRMEITGRLVDASNATLFGTVGVNGVELRPVLAASFGCPCHGGQYSPEGNRTSGSPVRALAFLD